MALRELDNVLLAARNSTVPFPLPVLPDEIVNQFALLDEVHEQPAAAKTDTDPVAPAGVLVIGPMEIRYVQPTADSVTV